MPKLGKAHQEFLSTCVTSSFTAIAPGLYGAPLLYGGDAQWCPANSVSDLSASQRLVVSPNALRRWADCHSSPLVTTLFWQPPACYCLRWNVDVALSAIGKPHPSSGVSLDHKHVL